MVDSIAIAKYFLFLDKQKKYFYESKNNLSKKEEELVTWPSSGNFRLNKLLFIANVLCIAKNDELFFNSKICAFECGPIVYKVFKSFRKISEHRIGKEDFFELTIENKKYIKKIYKVFSKYSDQELLDFICEDPNWFLARKKLHSGFDQEYKNYIIFDKKDFQFYKERLSIYVNRFDL